MSESEKAKAKKRLNKSRRTHDAVREQGGEWRDPIPVPLGVAIRVQNMMAGVPTF
jgi:hypothetical protein